MTDLCNRCRHIPCVCVDLCQGCDRVLWGQSDYCPSCEDIQDTYKWPRLGVADFVGRSAGLRPKPAAPSRPCGRLSANARKDAA